MIRHLSPEELSALRNRYKVQKPKAPIEKWQVFQCGQIMYENHDIKLCWYYIKTHKLKAVPKPKRKN